MGGLHGPCCSFVVLACALLPARALGRAARDSKVHLVWAAFGAHGPPLGTLLGGATTTCLPAYAPRAPPAAGREEGVSWGAASEGCARPAVRLFLD